VKVESGRVRFDLHASIVYQFHSIDILQSLLMSIAMLLIVELAFAKAAMPVAVAVDDMAIDMVDEDIFIFDNDNVMYDW
jgi:hypothetical protein